MQMTEKKVKPTIEEIAASFLDGEKLKNFLDFNESLKVKSYEKRDRKRHVRIYGLGNQI